MYNKDNKGGFKMKKLLVTTLALVCSTSIVFASSQVIYADETTDSVDTNPTTQSIDKSDASIPDGEYNESGIVHVTYLKENVALTDTYKEGGKNIQYVAPKTAWKYNKIAYYKGSKFYNIGGPAWIPAWAVADEKDGVEFNESGVVHVTYLKENVALTDTYKEGAKNIQYVAPKTAWKYNKVAYYKGSKFYNIGGPAWIPAWTVEENNTKPKSKSFPVIGSWTYWGGLNSYPGHTGVDIGARNGIDKIASVFDGVVFSTNKSCKNIPDRDCGGGLGNYVMIRTTYNGTNYVMTYAHMSTVNVNVGQSVNSGQILGVIGQSGYTQGAHLHLETLKGVTTRPGSKEERIRRAVDFRTEFNLWN